MNWILKKILGSKNERDLKKMRPLVEKINAFDEEYKALSDEQLQANYPRKNLQEECKREHFPPQAQQHNQNDSK